jgi:diacylglycerol O-acyltransferase / wax synthase
MPLLDLAFLWIDRPETPSNVGVLMLFDPPPGGTAAAAAARIVRAYRAARPGHPFDAVPDVSMRALPHWRQAGRIDLRRHVIREPLAAPGDLAELCRRVAELHEAPLDRSRPLFAVHVITGLASGQLAVYVKSHHSSWDGRYALERIFGGLGREPGPVTPPFFAAQPDLASADQPGSPAGGLATGMRSLMTQAAAARELIGRLAARPRTGPAAEPPRGNRPFAGPHTRFNEPVKPGRTYACFSLPLAGMRQAAQACGGTLNDVALAVVDAGVERFLAGLGERPRQPLVAMCPVSLRDPGDREATTKAATLFVPLARPRSGAVERLRQIAAHTRDAKIEFRSFSREAALDYALLAFGLWFASSTLGLGAVARPVVNLVVSNVGAVDGTRYLGECRLAAAYPVSMLADPCGLNVTVVSVDGHMDFGIVANAAVVADAFEIARECEAAFTRLVRATRRSPAAPAARRTPRRKRVRP